MGISRRDYDEIVNQLDEAQAEIDELVDMLEYFYEYGYERLKAERLLRKHKGE